MLNGTTRVDGVTEEISYYKGVSLDNTGVAFGGNLFFNADNDASLFCQPREEGGILTEAWSM